MQDQDAFRHITKNGKQKKSQEITHLVFELLQKGAANETWAHNANRHGGLGEVETRVNSFESPYGVLLVNYHRDVVLRASLCYCSHIYVSLKPLNNSTSRDMEQS
jgi:hypothetical protein